MKWKLIVAIVAAISAIAGTATAFADAGYFTAWGGSHTYWYIHSEPNYYPNGFPNYYYEVNDNIWANAGFPSATSMSSNYINRANGSAGMSDNPWLSEVYLYDEYGYSFGSGAFICVRIASLSSATIYPTWSYSGFNATNDYMVVEQRIKGYTGWGGSFCNPVQSFDAQFEVIEAQ